jgi:hypothetical protein
MKKFLASVLAAGLILIFSAGPAVAMTLWYDDTDGRIYYAVYDRDDFAFSHSTHLSLSAFDIDEIDDNAALCRDLWRLTGKQNAEGQGKYYIDSAGPSLVEREGWTEAVTGGPRP